MTGCKAVKRQPNCVEMFPLQPSAPLQRHFCLCLEDNIGTVSEVDFCQVSQQKEPSTVHSFLPPAVLPSRAAAGAGTQDPSSALHLSACSREALPQCISDHLHSGLLKGEGRVLWLVQWIGTRTSPDFVSPMQLSVADTNISCSRSCPQVLVVIFTPCTGLH